MIDKIDAIAKGKGYSIAQAKIKRKDGTIEYRISKPNIKWYDVIGWTWYLAHKRHLIKEREQ